MYIRSFMYFFFFLYSLLKLYFTIFFFFLDKYNMYIFFFSHSSLCFYVIFFICLSTWTERRSFSFTFCLLWKPKRRHAPAPLCHELTPICWEYPFYYHSLAHFTIYISLCYLSQNPQSPPDVCLLSSFCFGFFQTIFFIFPFYFFSSSFQVIICERKVFSKEVLLLDMVAIMYVYILYVDIYVYCLYLLDKRMCMFIFVNIVRGVRVRVRKSVEEKYVRCRMVT